MQTVPKKLHHIWVGPKPAPLKWMQTWNEKHPDWEYKLWGNEELYGRVWRNQKQLDVYLARQEWPGVADIMRYEILHEEGGFMPGSDAVCFHNVEELLQEPGIEVYSMYENEKVRPGLVSPIHAAVPGAAFLNEIIEALGEKDPAQLGPAWTTTGNLFMQHMIEKHRPETLRLWPSHYMIPVHYTGEAYKGEDKIYAQQMWGSTKKIYDQGI